MKSNSLLSIHNNPDNNLKIFLFNVGQGDQLLFRIPGGGYGILDSNFDDKYLRQKESPVQSYFECLFLHFYNGVIKQNPDFTEDELDDEAKTIFQKEVQIEFLCISHSHKDHIKGFNSLLEFFKKKQINISRLWIPGVKEKSFYDQLSLALIKEVKETNKGKILSPLQIQAHKALGSYENNITKIFNKIAYWEDRGENKLKKRYLEGFKPIDNTICRDGVLQVSCIGPLEEHLEIFEKVSFINHIKQILGDIYIYEEKEYLKKEEKALSEMPVDKQKIWRQIRTDENKMSHLLWFKFHNYQLIFGGDTHEYILKESIDNYLDLYPDQPEENTFYKNSDFIKVAHHGSKKSSSEEIWPYLLSNNKNCKLGISAGRNESYNHPSPETFVHLKNCGKSTSTFSTNICSTCLNADISKDKDGALLDVEVVYHDWYGDYLGKRGKMTSKNMKEKMVEYSFTLANSREGYSKESKEKIANDTQVESNSAGTSRFQELLAYEFAYNKSESSMKYHVFPTHVMRECFFAKRTVNEKRNVNEILGTEC